MQRGVDIKKLSHGKKLQSALELLTTYSWAFLIIAIFVAAAAIISGSRAPTSYITSTCSINPEFQCLQSTLSRYNATTPIKFSILFTNDLGALVPFVYEIPFNTIIPSPGFVINFVVKRDVPGGEIDCIEKPVVLYDPLQLLDRMLLHIL